MSTLDDVNSLDDAAAYLKVSPAVLIRLARTNKIAYLKTGRTITFTREGLEAYRVGHEVPAVVVANPHGLTNAAARRVRSRA